MIISGKCMHTFMAIFLLLSLPFAEAGIIQVESPSVQEIVEKVTQNFA